MKISFTLAAWALLPVLVSHQAIAGSPDKSPPTVSVDSAWSQPLFGAGIKSNDNYTDGNVFLTLPIWSTIGQGGKLGGDYLFIEPYSSAGDGGEVAASLGLSWRHLFSDEPLAALSKKGRAGLLEEGWFLGGSLFMDMLDTQHRNSFWQLGVGLEAGTRYFEVRGNYYIPLTGEKLYDRQERTQTFSSSKTSYSTVPSYGDPYATGNSVLQPATYETVATTQTTTTKVRTITELFEKGMKGWDADACVLLPWLDQWFDARVLGGYFSFDNQPFGPQNGPTGPVHGWKAGLEVRPVPALLLSGMWYQDKRLTGDNWTVGAQLQIPLDHSWKDAFKFRRRHLIEHLAEPVHRQNDAVKVGNRASQQQTSHSSTAVTVRVVNRTGGLVTIADSVIYVNADGVNALEDGTFEHPFATVPQGCTLAGRFYNATSRVWTVIIQGQSGGGNYDFAATGGTTAPVPTVPLVLPQNIVLLGSGLGGGFQALGGKFALSTGSIRPVIAGSVSAASGTLKMQGITLINGSISAQNMNSVTIDNCTVYALSGDAVSIVTNGSHSTTAVLTNNNLRSSWNGVSLTAGGDGRIDATLTGNNITHAGAGDGLLLSATGHGVIKAQVSDGEITDASAAGIHAISSGVGSGIVLFTSGVNIHNNWGDGIWLSTSINGSLLSEFTGNQIVNNGLHGVLASAVNTTDPALVQHLSAIFTGNQITGNGEDGVNAQLNNSGVMTLALRNNDISNNKGSGFSGNSGLIPVASSTAMLYLEMTNNTLTSNASAGFQIGMRENQALWGPSGTALIKGNTLSGNTSGGGLIMLFGSSVASVNMTGNIIDASSPGPGSHTGMIFGTLDASSMDVIFNSNTIKNADPYGLQLGQTLAGKMVFGAGAPILNNTFSNNGTNVYSNYLDPANISGSIMVNGVGHLLPVTF